MPEIDDATLDYLFARAGLSPTPEQKAGVRPPIPMSRPWPNVSASHAAAWRSRC